VKTRLSDWSTDLHVTLDQWVYKEHLGHETVNLCCPDKKHLSFGPQRHVIYESGLRTPTN